MKINRNALKYEIDRICKGKRVYLELQKKGGKMLIFPHRSLGDIYVLSLFRDMKNEMFNDKYMLVVSGSVCKYVAEMHNFSCVECIDDEQMSSLIKYIMVIGEDNLNCKILHFLYYYTSISYELIDYMKYNFIECYSKLIFNQKLDLSLQTYHYKKISKENIEKYNLIKGKTVIIAPYAKSVYNLPFEFWQNVVVLLRNEGYKHILTNCGPNENPLQGTMKLDVKLEDMPGIIEYCGYFIALRSGLCDLVSMSKGKKVIVYPKDSFIKDSITYYSLNLLPFTRSVYEFTYDGMEIPFDQILDFMGE